jgi:anti-sigma regulatory factor (Ser/Thr protein kinase)
MCDSVDAGAVRPHRCHDTATAGSHAHVGFVTGSDDELLAGVLPYVEEGLQDGDLVLLSCSPVTAALITSALGDRADEVTTDGRMSLHGARVPDAVSVTGEWVRRAAGSRSGRLRVVGQVPFDEEPRTWREGLRYEAAANRLLTADVSSVLCLFDTRLLPAPVLDGVGATHPVLLSGGTARPSGEYRDPVDFARRLPLPREPVEDAGPVFDVTDAPSLAALRGNLRAVISARVPDRDQAEDLHFAASEVASNAFRHGARPVSARVWVDDDRIVCAITDSGPGFDDPFTGFRPAHGDDLALGGMGLWLARKLWDHVDVLPASPGVTVRLSTRLT